MRGMPNSKELKFTDAIQDGWNAMSTEQRTIVGVLGLVDAAGKAAALFDLSRTDAKKLRGPKWLWGSIIPFVNTLGWAAYFAVGKKR